MTTAEKEAFNQAVLKLVAWYLRDLQRRDREILLGLQRLERLIDEAFAAPPPRRRLFR